MDKRHWLAVVAVSVSACGGVDASRSDDAGASTTITTTQNQTTGRAGDTDADVAAPATTTPLALAPANPSLPDPLEPLDCSTVVDGAELLAEEPASVDELNEQLGLMRELHVDTVLIWEEFGIQPDHLMVDGTPLMLIGIDDAGDRCEDIVAVVDHPDLVQMVRWTEDDYARLHEQGSPPWRRLIEAEIGSPFDDTVPQKWTEMSKSFHGVTSITLNRGEEALAAQLASKYGPLVDLRVGNFAYDPQDGIVATNDICVDLPDDTARSDLVVGKGRIVGGLEGGRVLFDVVNTGPTTVHIVPGRLARLTGAGESRSVTEFTGAMTMEDRGSIAVPSGGTETVGGTISLDACDPSNGTELPPGAYDATLAIAVFDVESFESDHSDEVLVARLTIEIPQPD